VTKATIATTKGDIVVELDDVGTPKAAGNFIKLARQGFLRRRHLPPRDPGLRRPGRRTVSSGARTRRPDPQSRPRRHRWPGYKFEDEPFTGDYHRGALAMAERRPEHEWVPVLHLPPGPAREAAQELQPASARC